MKTIINSPKNLTPAGAYSHAVKVDNLVFVSGLLPMDKNGAISQDLEEQVRQCFTNLKNICDEVRCGFENIVKINVYYTKPEVSPFFDKIMIELFQAPYPARIRLMVAGIAKDCFAEIDAIISL